MCLQAPETPKRRRSLNIQQRISALQASGSCLEDLDNAKVKPRCSVAITRRKVRNSLPALDSMVSSPKPSLNRSYSSMLDLATVTQEPITPIRETEKPTLTRVRSSVSFAEMANVCMIPELQERDFDSLYFKEEELADFRHEAFLEKCGLSPDDF